MKALEEEERDQLKVNLEIIRCAVVRVQEKQKAPRSEPEGQKVLTGERKGAMMQEPERSGSKGSGS